MDVMSLAEREAARRAENGDAVVRMEVGQPAGPAPNTSRDAVRAALDSPLGYTPALGLQALRERIARHYLETYGVEIDPARVIVTSGSSAGFQLAFLALFDAGDRLAMADPGYPSYRNIAQALDLIPTRLEAFRDSGFQPTPELWAKAQSAHGRLAGLLTASPANPTGAMLDRPALIGLIEAVAADGGAFISDEIYHGLHYGAPAVSALQIAEPLGVETIVINSFSKYYAMTGWRIGWMIAPERLARTIERLAQNLFICPPHISQVAALAAFDGVEELEQRRLAYAANRTQ
ncbi:MAG: aminotransferase class I/II-fold pyridoxal phosphate-dependent enzyme, partial [Rhodobacteraceae bacterium]|nr:aminotransferase class I/II-fold pyridoxal phosphate-dependent enzyme [Paracoccaceae bacterium]